MRNRHRPASKDTAHRIDESSDGRESSADTKSLDDDGASPERSLVVIVRPRKTTTTTTTTTTSCTPSSSAQQPEHQQQQQQRKRDDHGVNFRRRRRRWLIVIMFHTLPLCLLAVGMALCFVQLYTAGECEMTYSRRTFVEIPVGRGRGHGESSTTTTGTSTGPYRLWKFIDERDPRYGGGAGVGRRPNNDRNSTIDDDHHHHCRPNVPLVLYVPGHYGSYEQSRSLGAHGTQLTSRVGGTNQERRIVQALRATMTTKATGRPRPNDHNDHNNNASSSSSSSSAASLDDFFYDVYAVDFNEEGSAFHGSILQRQAKFIASSIETLTRTCARDHLFIVAHSLGGISAKLAATQMANDRTNDDGVLLVHDKVAAIITLATPHAYPVWTWEPQVFNVYRTIASSQKMVTAVPTISICGDYRDEMIPPDACDNAAVPTTGGNIGGTEHHHHEQQPNPTIMSIHASDITTCSIGMDHRAIVWCHNVLSQVRSILFVLESETTKGRPDMMAAATAWFQSNHNLNVSQYNYLDRTMDVKDKLKSASGMFRGLLIEIGLLHNMPILMDLFATNGAIRYAFPTVTQAVTVPVTILTHFLVAKGNRISVSLPVYTVLALIANTVFSVLYWLFTKWSQSSVSQFLRRHLLVGAGGLALLGGYLVVDFVATSTTTTTTTSSCRRTAVATISSSLFGALILLVPGHRSRQSIRYSTWLLPLLLPMVMGDWLAVGCHSSWTVTLFMVPICARLLLLVKDLPPALVDGRPPIVKLVRCFLLLGGVWDNLSSRHDRGHRRMTPVYASLFVAAACLDLALFGVWKLAYLDRPTGSRVDEARPKISDFD